MKKAFNQISFSTWFNETKLYEITDNTIVLLVPMAVHKRMFLSTYYNIISDAFAEITGIQREIQCLLENEIEVKDDLSNTIFDSVDNENDANNQNFESNLIKSYLFDNFVVGDTNKFARTAALAVAEKPGELYNPLFIYGKSGLGKTHLMHAIGNYIEANNPSLKVLYTTSDEFRKDYTGISTTDNSVDYATEFKSKYRDIDVLIIDDIQYLVGAEKTQEEFFHTFNELHQKNKQIIISSDRSPEDLKLLEERLTSRFAWGLPVDIYPPDFELRCRIIRDKIKYLNTINDKMTDEAIEFDSKGEIIPSSLPESSKELIEEYKVIFTSFGSWSVEIDNSSPFNTQILLKTMLLSLVKTSSISSLLLTKCSLLFSFRLSTL